MKRQVLLLSLCQALAMTGNVVLFTVAALTGQALATDKSLATLPIALLQLATMSVTIPASLLMRHVGRQLGFFVGILIGLSGAGLGIYAIATHSFILFCGAMILFGSFNSFVSFYRFAAAEVATEAFRSQAISLVIAGGVLAALVGPQLATWSKDWLQPVVFAGSLVTIAILQSISLCLLPFVKLPPPAKGERQGKGRSLPTILRQPVFITAVLGSMLGYGVMTLVMTATPLAMVADAHPFHEAASVIQWHVLGMFSPSFFTGFLIARFGLLTILSWGSGLSLLCLAINLWGTGLLSYSIALLLLGIGWNFLFIGSTTLLTEAYTPPEKAKTQAIHDFMMFAFVAFTTLLSGSLFQNLGWKSVNLAGIPMMLLVLAAIAWLRYQRQKEAYRGQRAEGT
ncbi:MFS transporter [Kovacikia minuta CCNUW1]|uniref:MFS transporter n=1 Tax=Kovacikia minuta TaxID=2931930 RepID=UPI001CCA1326|nr:MFS transporter [Kovacikia minuta]UBF27231.1 MFS transporter [Kovacikia minuta CCNUW1]